MSFEEGLFNMYDSRLKHRLLHSIMMSHLPDEKQLPRSPAQLSVAVASIRRHHLLAETPSSGTPGMSKSGEPRKSVVDGWVDHLLGLLCSTVAENRWAGLCLLGVTCQECSRQRFLESYNSWFQKLLLPLKQSTDPVFIRAAACASLTDLLTRLGSLVEYAGVRRDGAALIAKLVQPILQILGDKDSSGIWNEAIDLLSSILRCFPACLRQQTNNLESLLVARLMDSDSSSLSQKCALCLALLPKAHGDVTMWSSMIRRILIAINTELEYAFSGMEDVASAEDALATLLPLGQDPPWPLGGPSVAANASAQAAKSFWQQLVPRVSSLLQCCQSLLTNPYPVPVPVPIKPLLALATRVLRVDGSRISMPNSMNVAVSSVHQVSLCSELPALHISALDLLSALLCGVRSQLLPHGGDVVRLVSESFRRCGSVAPVLRVKLYDFARHLFVAMGAGMASALAPAVVGSALSDLKGSTLATSIFSPKASRTPRMNSSGWAPGNTWGGQNTNHRKRKEPGGCISNDHQNNGTPEGAANMSEGAATAAVQIAALRALEALLTSGGALLPDRWRAEVDAVLASVAMGAATGTASLIFDEDSTYMDGGAPVSSGAFQVAAYRALLSSLLSPCCHRPPYLAQGLAIFRKGRQEAGSEVAEVCAHALLALEPLIHPRCLPPAGAMSAGLATGRALSTGGLVPHMQRPGKPLTASGNVSVVPAASATISFAGPVVPPALKIGQLAMDPWAEVDTWLGYGEDFGEEDGLFYEDENMLVDEFNGGLDSGVGPTGYYVSDQQTINNGQGGPVVVKIGERDGDNVVRPLEDTKVQGFAGDDSHVRSESGLRCGLRCELSPRSALAQDVMLEPGDAYRDHTADSASTRTETTIADGDDCPSPNKQDILFSSQLQSLGYAKEDPLAVKTDDGANTAAVGIMQGSIKDGADVDVESGSDMLNRAFPSMSGPKTPAMAPFSFSNVAVEIGSESDSDGVLPDIIDGDPDSD
ncbi:proline-, glutamic acid- and leucine-rich protein 1 [Marchantia polymorpha subsp. ruderalis]|uniref:Pre-rRNA-processing protein RIX1 N-terminal domain-containing protein n=2 Tax=Marchantia polymorpha TaxID=3197 RepID=A0A176W8B8_MARPO|nr:hypothetical protein AXG93_2255s1260 [Marchantia polymorpha subsp. ruderalis]PTQ31693.1 hypothetical protein MARPO_0108s0040 [Marchantia polymorpha]BBN19841.1 hypothetical protein Mp_8g14130 [Marchantia polymorpha subsp. ruderalis]|eukprot:PTQ31693.1 hypothetical protein MARPO_0108s0040 [Marchantia polymorpha]